MILTEVSGTKFNDLYKNTKFYKFLNDDMIHHYFEYIVGLNIDHNVFCPNKGCLEGGLYFCEASKCHLYWSSYGKKIALIKIPNNARVCIDRDSFKADRLIIDEICRFEYLPIDFWMRILKHTLLISLTESECRLTMARVGNVLYYIDHTDSGNKIIRRLDIQQNGWAVWCDKDFTDEVSTLVSQQDGGDAFEYVKNQHMRVRNIIDQKVHTNDNCCLC